MKKGCLLFAVCFLIGIALYSTVLAA